MARTVIIPTEAVKRFFSKRVDGICAYKWWVVRQSIRTNVYYAVNECEQRRCGAVLNKDPNGFQE